MTIQQPINADAVASHFEIERFQVYAASELAAAPYFQRGICFQPECSKSFNPAREWQVFCCTACGQKAAAEYRAFGHRVALPMLIHRMGKYEKHDEGVMDLNRAARRFVTHAQSAWLLDRQRRIEIARGAV